MGLLLRCIFGGRFRFRVFYFAVLCCEPIADFLWFVFKWAHSAAIGDLSLFIHDVEPFRPGGIEVVDRVRHVIDAEGNGKAEALDEIVGDGEALVHRFGLHVANIFFDVRFHLPFVGGMRFADVYGQKIGVVFVIIEDLHDVADLATKWRSSEAAEDEDKWLAVDALANLKMIRAV